MRANDTKASAVLVIHALLATALLSKFDVYAHVIGKAPADVRHFFTILLGAIAAAFLASVFCLIAALWPSTPSRLNTELLNAGHSVGLAFPTENLIERHLVVLLRDRKIDPLTAPSPRGPLLTRLHNLASYQLESELLSELVKVSAILSKERKYARRGYLFLGLEIMLLVSFLTWIGIRALDAHPVPVTRPALTWNVLRSGRQVLSSRPNAQPQEFDLSRNFSDVEVTVRASDQTELRRLELWKVTRYFCVERQANAISDNGPNTSVSATDLGSGASGHKQLKLTQRLAPSDFGCPQDGDASTAAIALTAEATTETGAAARETIVLHAPLIRRDPIGGRRARSTF